MGGLSAARVLADHYETVTVVERDVLPHGSANRRGVPQGRHGHAILGRGLAALADFFPGFADDLVAAGVPALDYRDMSEAYLRFGCHLLTAQRNLTQCPTAVHCRVDRCWKALSGSVFASDRQRESARWLRRRRADVECERGPRYRCARQSPQSRTGTCAGRRSGGRCDGARGADTGFPGGAGIWPAARRERQGAGDVFDSTAAAAAGQPAGEDGACQPRSWQAGRDGTAGLRRRHVDVDRLRHGRVQATGRAFPDDRFRRRFCAQACDRRGQGR